MRFARDNWVQERASWKAVLQLNLVHSVNTILKALQTAFDNDDCEEEQEQEPLPFTPKHQLLRLRLRPLGGVEADLKRLLGVKSEDILEQSPPTSPWLSPRTSRTSSEFFVRSRNWRNFLQASRIDESTESSCRPIKHDGVSSQDITEVIAGCKDDIIALWADDVVREMLRRHKVRLEDSASLFVLFFLSILPPHACTIASFLDNTQRLAIRDYEPTDDDIVRARLRTLDIQEYELDVAEGTSFFVVSPPSK